MATQSLPCWWLRAYTVSISNFQIDSTAPVASILSTSERGPLKDAERLPAEIAPVWTVTALCWPFELDELLPEEAVLPVELLAVEPALEELRALLRSTKLASEASAEA